MATFKLSREQEPLLSKYANEMTFRTIVPTAGKPEIRELDIEKIIITKEGTYIHTIGD